MRMPTYLLPIESKMEIFARMYSKNMGVDIKFGPRFETNGKTIFIVPVTDQHDPWIRFMTEVIVYHETGHIWTGDYPSFNAISDKTKKSIFNIVRDVVVEKTMETRYPGLSRKWSEFLTQFMAKEGNKNFKKENALTQLLKLFYLRCREKLLQADFGIVVIPEVQEMFDRKLAGLIDEGVKIDSIPESLKLTEKIYAALKQDIEDQKKPQPQQPNKPSKKSSKDQDSGDQDSGDQDSGDQDSGDQDSGDQDSGDQDSGDQDSGDQDSGDQDSGDQDSGDQDSGDQDSGDQDSGDDSDKGDGEETDEDKDKDGDQGGDEGTDSDDEDGKGSDSGSPDDKDDGAENSGDSSDEDNGSEDDPSEGSDSKDEENDGDPSDDDGDEPVSDGAKALDKDLKVQMKDGVTGETLPDEVKTKINTYANAHKIYRTAPGLQENFTKIPLRTGWETEVTRYETEGRKTVGFIGGKLKRLLVSERAPVTYYNLNSGKLDIRRVHKITQGRRDIFKKRYEGAYEDAVVYEVIDHSGSMTGTKAEHAQSILCAVSSDLDRLRIPFGAVGFTSDGEYDPRANEGIRCRPCDLRVIKTFEEPYRRVRHRFVWPNTKGTVELPGIQYAAYQLAQRRETKKILFILSDGSTESGNYNLDEALVAATKEFVRRIIRAGIRVVGIGLYDDSLGNYCPDFIHVMDIDSFAKDFYFKLTKLLL